MDDQQLTTGARPLRGEPYRGRYRVNPDRTVDVWNGTQYVPRDSLAALPSQEDRRQLADARPLLGIARQNARLADRFIDTNQEVGTGGWLGLPVPAELQSAGRQRLEGYTNQMVRANIREGTSGTMNSIIEQMLARQQYPTTNTYGETNVDRALQMAVDEQEIMTMIEEAERWAREHRGLQGFDVHWTRNRSRQVRAEAERRIREDSTRPYRPRGSSQRTEAPPAGIDAREWSNMNAQERRRVREILGQ